MSDEEEVIIGDDPTVFDDLDFDGEDWDGQGTSWVDMLPEWDPHHRQYGIYQDGIVGVMVGHKGGGKSRTMTKLCQLYQPFVDRAACVSSTDVRNGQFGRAGLIHPAYISERPTLDDIAAVVEERRLEMKMWEAHYREGYRQRSLMYILDDAGYASQVLGKRTDEMMYLFTNARHLGLHMYIALQTMGLLSKQLRINVDLTFIVREHNGEALGSMYDSLFKYNTAIAPSVFREMMDQVCIRGKRIMVWDGRYGMLFKYTLDFDKITLPRPLGNRWWLAKGDQILKGRAERRRPEDELDDAVRRRWAPAQGRGNRK